MLCAIGLLVTVVRPLAFPRFGEITQSVEQFLWRSIVIWFGKSKGLADGSLFQLGSTA
jgi:hypothetical protein